MLLDFTSVAELFCTYPKSDSNVQTLMIVSQNVVKIYKFGASHDVKFSKLSNHMIQF